jgi:hypothetical protein
MPVCGVNPNKSLELSDLLLWLLPTAMHSCILQQFWNKAHFTPGVRVEKLGANFEMHAQNP